jgi:hypothetical protein
LGKKKRATNPHENTPFSKGNINYLIDDFLHPLYQQNQLYRIADGLLHAVVEQNPRLSLKKFIKYNAIDLLKSKKTAHKGKRGS